MPSRKPSTSEEAAAIAAEMKLGRGVPPQGGRGKISRDTLSEASGVKLETLKWIEEAKSARPDDAHAAAFYDALGLTPELAPNLALARARWALDPRRPGGMPAALEALEATRHVLLEAGGSPIPLSRATIAEAARRLGGAPQASPLDRDDVDGEGQAP